MDLATAQEAAFQDEYKKDVVAASGVSSVNYVWITGIRQGAARRHLLATVIETEGVQGRCAVCASVSVRLASSNMRRRCLASNLWGAARSGSVYEVSTFLAFGTDVNARADKLRDDVWWGFAAVCLEQHDDFGTKGATALTEASWNGAYDLVSYLIDVGANVNKKDSRKASPIHHAAKQGHSDVMTLLIKSGAHVDARDKNNETPLHLAVNTQEERAVQLLLEKGADVNSKAYVRTFPPMLGDGDEEGGRAHDGDTPLDRSKKTLAGKKIAKLL
eukprot:gene7397-8808_t